MTKYIFPDKTDLVNYLYEVLDNPSPIKIQKTLYLLFAYYGATYGKINLSNDSELDISNYTEFLFEPNFEAWMYGPVDFEVYERNKNGEYSAQKLSFESLNNELNLSEKQNIVNFSDNIIRQTNVADDLSLVDRTHEDESWSVPYEKGNGAAHIPMNPYQIVEEYSTKYVQ